MKTAFPIVGLSLALCGVVGVLLTACGGGGRETVLPPTEQDADNFFRAQRPLCIKLGAVPSKCILASVISYKKTGGREIMGTDSPEYTIEGQLTFNALESFEVVGPVTTVTPKGAVVTVRQDVRFLFIDGAWVGASSM